MDLYVAQSSIERAITYFSGRQYNKPEQIGLMFYFKAAGISKDAYITYPKWGEMQDPDKRVYLRTLYDLAGIFDSARETGLKRTALFPFSITDHYRSNTFYNGATIFSRLVSRISDTLDNALVSTLIQRNTQAVSQIRLRDNFTDKFYTDYLRRQKIPVEMLATWYYRNWKVEMPDGATHDDFSDVCTLKLLLDFNITEEEYRTFFQLSGELIESSTTKITGPTLRQILRIDGDSVPEVNEDEHGDFMSLSMSIDAASVHELLTMCGGNLTEERIIEILSSRDAERLAALPEVEPPTTTDDSVTPATELPIRFHTGFTSPFERNRIIFGAPGTGKSHLLNENRAELLNGYHGSYERVTFHPDYTYSQFVGCYKPVTNDDGEIRYDFVPGPFMRIYAAALASAIPVR